MARPRKELHEKRDQRFNLRCTAAEIEHLRAQAARAGLDPHEYARRRALGHVITPAPARARSDPALISELNRIGVNVNQLARAIHQSGEFTNRWQEISTELRAVLEKIVRGHGA